MLTECNSRDRYSKVSDRAGLLQSEFYGDINEEGIVEGEEPNCDADWRNQAEEAPCVERVQNQLEIQEKPNNRI